MKCQFCENNVATADSHHIVPREFGGENLPEISICPSCHTTVHRCVNNPSMKDFFLSIIPPKNKLLVAKVIAIMEAHRATGNKVGKIKVIVELDREVHARLKLLASDKRSTLANFLEQLIKKIVGF